MTWLAGYSQGNTPDRKFCFGERRILNQYPAIMEIFNKRFLIKESIPAYMAKFNNRLIMN